MIIGGGPVGLCLAVELGWRGVDCVVVEQRKRDAAAFPTANHVGIRTMEHLRRLGLAREVAAAFQEEDHGHWIALTYIGGPEVGRVAHALAGPPRDASPEHEVWAPKPCFDPILERAAESHSSVTLRHATRVLSVSDRQEYVECTIEERSSRKATLRARFAVACDGAGSRVRDACGIAMIGPPPIPIQIHSAFFRSRRVRDRVPAGGVQFSLLGTPAGPTATPFGAGLMVAVDGNELWRLHGPGLDADDEAASKARLVDLGADDAEILAMSAWTPNQALAESFRHGRVFLAGDAAHVVTPYGGLGVNTGMADAFDLGWKIEATLAGWGGPRLLDESYDFERRAAAVDLLRYQKVDFSGEEPVRLGPPFPLYDAPRDDLWEEGRKGEEARRAYGAGLVASRGDEYEKPAIDLGYRYDGSPILCDDGSAPPDRSDASRYVATTKPGGRAPHVDLGARGSTLDLFGRGFVLVRTSNDVDIGPLEVAAAAARVPLRTEAIEGRGAAYETELTLVRPDGFVAWRGAALPADPAALLDTVRGI